MLTTSPTHNNYGSTMVLPLRHTRDFAYQAPPLLSRALKRSGSLGMKLASMYRTITETTITCTHQNAPKTVNWAEAEKGA